MRSRKNSKGFEIAVKYKKVTAETRIPAVNSGEVDLECGSTTASFDRKKEVAFSPVFFVAGTKLLVPRSSGIISYRDLRDKTVVVTAGTTNEAAVRAISDKQHLGIKLLVGKDHAESFAILTEGNAAAFRNRRRAALRPGRDGQVGRPVSRRRRISVIRPAWADLPQG
jgi:glutamate/aspartate transport system substrate-binding protein